MFGSTTYLFLQIWAWYISIVTDLCVRKWHFSHSPVYRDEKKTRRMSESVSVLAIRECRVVGIVTRLRAGRTGVRIPFGDDFLISKHVNTGSGAHPTTYSMVTSTHLHRAQRLRLSEAVCSLSRCAFVAGMGQIYLFRFTLVPTASCSCCSSLTAVIRINAFTCWRNAGAVM